MTYLQTIRHANAAYRDDWVIKKIKKYATTDSSSTVLDVGAGLSPYRKTVEALELKYFSQDFDMYLTSTSQSPGLQNGEWNYPKHTFTCDVLDIPET